VRAASSVLDVASRSGPLDGRLPIEQSTTYFESRGAAQEAGKKALTELLAKLSA